MNFFYTFSISTRIYGITSQMIALFIVIAVRISNQTRGGKNQE
jgi:hypothetical protein